MKLKDSESLSRYIHEMTRYMSYEKAEEAKKDFLRLIEEKLGTDTTEEKIEEYLEKIGSPYSISSQYEEQANFIMNGKNYELYNKMMKILFLSVIIANIVSVIKGYYKGQDIVNILKVIINQMVIIFTGLTISFFIAERIKNNRIIFQEIEGFKISDLYRKSQYKVKPSLAVLIALYTCFILIAITPLKLYGNNSLYILLVCIFFLNILRDVNKLAESRYSKTVLVLMFISDFMAITGMSFYLKGIIKDTSMISAVLLLLMLSSIYDLCFAIYETIKLKRQFELKEH